MSWVPGFAATPPKHIISDQGAQFQNKYRAWCKCVGVRPRFGAVGKSGSIAFIERFWLSMKNESFRIIPVPFSVQAMHAELDAYITWYNEFRPHQSLQGATPLEKLRGHACRPKLDLTARTPPVLAAPPLGQARPSRLSKRLSAQLFIPRPASDAALVDHFSCMQVDHFLMHAHSPT